MLTILALSLFTACAPPISDTLEEQQNINNVVHKDEQVSEEVPFSELNDSISNTQKIKEINPEGYTVYKFREGSGECVNKGVYKELNYIYDLNLEYQVMRSEDRKYFDQYVTLDFNGNLRFDGVPVTDGALDCTMKTEVGSDTALLTCTLEGEEYCTGNYKVWAQK